MSDPQAQIHRFHLQPDQIGPRLDRLLVQLLPEHSRSMLKGLIDAGQVLVDDQIRPPKFRPKAGQTLTVTIPPPRKSALEPVEMPIEVLFEDAHLMILVKRAGLVVHPAPTVHEPTLVHGLLALSDDFSGIGGEERPGIVHRLDRGTSGVMVVAKNEACHRGLVELFKVHDIQRRYIALIRGHLKVREGTWESHQGRHPKNRLKMASVKKGGRVAITHYRALEHYDGASLIELTLETGRTHQIRVHCSEAGHAILGDGVYGKNSHRNLPNLPGLREALAQVDHQLLHAKELGFKHPITGEALHFIHPPPPDFQKVLDCFRGEDAK